MAIDIERLIGQRIASYRRAATMTQEQLAEKVRVTPETISRLERGITSPTLSTLVGISRALDVPLRELVDSQAIETATDKALASLVRDLRRRKVSEIEGIHEIVKHILRLSSRGK